MDFEYEMRAKANNSKGPNHKKTNSCSR